MSIPGYVRDKNGRYYRRNVVGAPEFVENMKEEKSDRVTAGETSARRKGNTSLPSSVYLYQAGLKTPSNMATELFKAKLQSLVPSGVFHTRPTTPYFDCYYVSNTGKYYYVAGRNVGMDFPNSFTAGCLSLDKISFSYEEIRYPDAAVIQDVRLRTGYLEHQSSKIVDLCAAEDRVLFIMNADHRRHRLNTAGLVTTYEEVPDEDTISRSHRCWCFNKALRCCAYSHATKTAAFGTENTLVVLINMLRTQKFRGINEDVFAVDFCDYGYGVYYGSSSGKVCCADVRDETGVQMVDIGEAVIQIKTLSDDNTLIISGFNNKLCYADTRMKKVVLWYEGHKNKSSKLPLSVNESRRLICACGDDNSTRFWSFDDSKPLASISAPVPNSRQQVYSFMRFIDRRIYAHIFSGNKIYSYKPL